MAAIEALKDDSVIVFIDGSNLHRTPKAVQEAVASEPAWGPLPIVATFDGRMERLLGAVGYYAMKDVNGFKNVKAALAKLRGKDVPVEESIVARPETWKDLRGRSIRASYVSSTAEEVILRLENGKHSTVKLSALSEGSRKRIAELAKR